MRIPNAELDRMQAACDEAHEFIGVFDPPGNKARKCADFASMARTDLPRLVAEYRELRKLAQDAVDDSGERGGSMDALAAYMKGDKP